MLSDEGFNFLRGPVGLLLLGVVETLVHAFYFVVLIGIVVGIVILWIDNCALVRISSWTVTARV